MKTAVISKDTEYAAMLVYELKRRGFDAFFSETYYGADVALIDLDSLDASSSVFGGVKIITFSYGGLATLKRPFSLDALTLLLEEYRSGTSNVTQFPITDPQLGRVYYKGGEAALSPLEFSVFNKICVSGGSVVTFDQLAEFFSANEGYGQNRLRVCINSIRNKLRPLFGYDPIDNQKGIGYRLHIVENR